MAALLLDNPDLHSLRPSAYNPPVYAKLTGWSPFGSSNVHLPQFQSAIGRTANRELDAVDAVEAEGSDGTGE